LAAWADQKGQVACKRNGRVFRVNPKNIMLEKRFYALDILTPADVHVFRNFVVETAGDRYAKRHHEKLLQDMLDMTKKAQLIRTNAQVAKEDKKRTENVLVQLFEDLHGSIERRALPLLEKLRQRTYVLGEDDSQDIDFMNFLSQQIMRTRKAKNDLEMAFKQTMPFLDLSRISSLASFCFAYNIGSSLFRDRHVYEILYVESPDGCEFLVGDQPTLNLLATGSTKPPDDLVLFYPVDPKLSIVLAPKEMFIGARLKDWDDRCMRQVNALMMENCEQLVIASKEATLAISDFSNVSYPPNFMN